MLPLGSAHGATLALADPGEAAADADDGESSDSGDDLQVPVVAFSVGP